MNNFIKVSEIEKLKELAGKVQQDKLDICESNLAHVEAAITWEQVCAVNKGNRNARITKALFIATANPETILKLIATLGAAKKVIEFYGDPVNWWTSNRGYQESIVSHDVTLESGGKLASEFLKEMGE